MAGDLNIEQGAVGAGDWPALGCGLGRLLHWVRCLGVLALAMWALAAQAVSVEVLHFDRMALEVPGAARRVTTFMQGREGLMWLGTPSGVVRYDGRSINSIAHANAATGGQCMGYVYSLHEDETGQIWAGTDEGLCRIVRSTDTIELVSGADSPAGRVFEVRLVAPAEPGALWIVSVFGLYRFDIHTQQMKRMAVGPSPDSLRMYEATTDHKGGLWLAMENGVWHLDPQGHVLSSATDMADALRQRKTGAGGRYISALLDDGQGRLWLALYDGLQVWDVRETKPRRSHIEAGLKVPTDFVSSVMAQRNGDVWIIFRRKGLYRWHPGVDQAQRVLYENALRSDIRLWEAYEGDHGMLWLSTMSSGLLRARFTLSGLQHFRTNLEDSESLSNPAVTAISFEGNSVAWVATFSGGLNRLDLSTGIAQQIPTDPFPDKRFRALVRVNPSLMWIGAELGGLLRFDPLTRKSEAWKLPDGQAYKVSTFLADEHGVTWVGTSKGLNRLNAQGQWLGLPGVAAGANGLPDEEVGTLFKDKRGRVWVGTRRGIFLWDEEAKRFSQPIQPSSNLTKPKSLVVHAFQQQANGRIWVASNQGIFELSGDRGAFHLTQWSGPAEVSKAGVQVMQLDQTGQMWVVANETIMSLDMDRGLAVSYRELLPQGEAPYVYARAVAVSSDGYVHIGVNGLLRFHPDAIEQRQSAPKVVLSDLLVLNKSVPLRAEVAGEQNLRGEPPQLTLRDFGVEGALRDAKRIVLQPQYSTVGFSFAALHYADPATNRYVWMLEGFDKRWIEGRGMGANANYTNLDPGTYTLKFKAAAAKGMWSEVRSVEVVVLSPYWRTWWWYTGVASAAVLAIYLMHYFRVRSLRQAKEQLTQEVSVRLQQVIEEKSQAETQREAAEGARRTIGQLSVMGRDIMALLDANEIHRRLCQSIHDLLGPDQVRVAQHSADGKRLHHEIVIEGSSELVLADLDLGDETSWTVPCVKQNLVRLLERQGGDGRSDKGQPPHDVPPWAQSGLCVPMIAKGEAIGLIAVFSRQPHAYGAVELDMLNSLAGHAAGALSNAHAYATLSMAQRRLAEREKLAGLGALVAGVSHELNTPLGNSLLVAEALNDNATLFVQKLGAGQLRRSELDSFCDTARTATQVMLSNLNNAVDMMRKFKQVSIDRTADLRRSFDLRELCEETASTMTMQLRAGGHELNIDVPPGIEMDSFPGSLGQVLANLLSNACDHGLAGRRQGRIEIQARPGAPGWVSIRFSDNGVGIPPEHLGRVFEPFFASRFGGGGSGLGLHVSHTLVTDLFGGRMRASSPPGAGARFIMELPLRAP